MPSNTSPALLCFFGDASTNIAGQCEPTGNLTTATSSRLGAVGSIWLTVRVSACVRLRESGEEGAVGDCRFKKLMHGEAGDFPL